MSNVIKANFKTEAFPVVLLLVSFLSGWYFWQNFPAQVPTHWDINGVVNGYSSPLFAAFFMPILTLGLYLLFLVLPYLDPKKDRYTDFAGAYHGFKNLLVAFMFIMFILVGVSGLGYLVAISFWMPILMAIFFIVLGNILSKVKMNWFLGIRTPWTLSSETVWKKTHELSVPIFSVAGILMAATVLIPSQFQIAIFIVAIALIAIGLPLYSYIIYRQEKN